MNLCTFIFIVLSIFISASSCGQQPTLHEEGFSTPYSPTARPRMAAEWEPALGTLITWPLSIPHKLVIELAKDAKLYVLVADAKSRQEAVNWLMKWKIMPDRVRFITAPQGVDASWTRDWGPHAFFTPAGEMKLADGKYLYSTPLSDLACNDTLDFIFVDAQKKVVQTTVDDRIPHFIGDAIGLDVLQLPFAFTGGNVISDGQRTGFSSCVISNENKLLGVTEEKFFHDLKQLLGIEQYHLISNFESYGIQHIDCLMKLLDEERLLVMRPPAGHPAYDQYEGIVQHELSHMRNAYGRPYQILRLDTDVYDGNEMAAYTNSLILNKTVYVPLFGIAQDTLALKQWQEAMPGYTIKGFEFRLDQEPALSEQTRKHYKIIGWNAGDALHCRTRAIWDPQMLYISVDRLSAAVAKANTFTVKVILKDYSQRGWNKAETKLWWRNNSVEEWKTASLVKDAIADHYHADIPGSGITGEVQYYVSVENMEGKKATMPVTAPAGFYSFHINDF